MVYEMTGGSLAASMVLRPATAGDARRIYNWRNDPWIVALSSSGRTVSWKEHEKWLRGLLASPEHLLFIIEAAGTGAGTVRLDRRLGGRAVVTIYLLREFTGKGLGPRALEEGCAQGFSRWPIAAIHAYIRSDNKPSLTAFSRAGFTAISTADCPPDHEEMMLHRP